MTATDIFRIELHFVVGTILYLVYMRIECYFPTMKTVDKRVVYALIFFLWPIMVAVLAEEYMRGTRDKDKDKCTTEDADEDAS